MKIKLHHRERAQHATLAHIRQWYESRVGQQVFDAGQAILEQLLPGLHLDQALFLLPRGLLRLFVLPVLVDFIPVWLLEEVLFRDEDLVVLVRELGRLPLRLAARDRVGRDVVQPELVKRRVLWRRGRGRTNAIERGVSLRDRLMGAIEVAICSQPSAQRRSAT